MADYPSRTELKIRKAVKDFVSMEDYKRIVERLILIATEGKRDLDAVSAAKVLIDRMEGSIPPALPFSIDENIPIVSRENFIGKYEGK